MLNKLVTALLRWRAGTPAFRIYGKARWETDWRVIDVFASRRHCVDSSWPLVRGACVTWSDEVIVVGWDLAQIVLREQCQNPASREFPVVVAGGRLKDDARRAAVGAPSYFRASEVLAHEVGHTAQARRLGALYLPVVGAVTRFREGPHWWNHFENQASEQGQLGGIVKGSVAADLMSALHDDSG
jgi:hypothetical protein